MSEAAAEPKRRRQPFKKRPHAGAPRERPGPLRLALTTPERPKPPSDSGAGALAVWLSVVAGMSIALRVALAEDGERLRVGAPWIGAFAAAAVVAVLLWLLARRRLFGLHAALSVGMLAVTVLHVISWASAHEARRRSDQRVFELVAKLDELQDEPLEAAIAEIERAKTGAGPATGRYADALIEIRRESRKRSAAFHEASDKVDNVLDLASVKAEADLDARIEALRTLVTESRALLNHSKTVRANLSARLASLDLPAHLRASLLGSVANQVAHKTRMQVGADVRESEQRWAEASIKLLEVLKAGWGKWEIDAKTGLVSFRDDDVKERYKAAQDGIERASGDLNKHNAHLTTLDVDVSTTSVPEARAAFTSRRRADAPKRSPDALPIPAPLPPLGVLKRIKYRSPAGDLAAYVTPDPRDGQKHPAVLWAHGGFGGIGAYFWEPASPENDQSARAFREAGLVLMCPSFRGENDNPGSFEMLYGELDDLLAARDHLATLPYVDGDRIYLAGHSAGGTLVLLAAEATDRFRAAFSFGGIADIGLLARTRTDTPFDATSAEEIQNRSPATFVGAIKRPTFYFEGVSAADTDTLRRMEALANKSGKPFSVNIVRGADHVNLLAPLTRLVAQKIAADTDPKNKITFTDDEVHAAFNAGNQPGAAK